MSIRVQPGECIDQPARTTVDRIREAAGALRLDGTVLLSPQGFTYATGLRIVSHPLMRWRHAAALVGPNGVDGVLAIDMERAFVAGALPSARLAVWKEFVDEPMEVLARLVTDVWGSGPLRLGIELDFVPAGRFEILRSRLPQVQWVAADAALEQARARKSSQELDIVRMLSLAADRALLTALRSTAAGDTEAQVGERIISALYATGVSEHRFLIAATGEGSQYANAGPTDRVVRPGDVVRVEVFASHHGYQAGVARTAVVGRASDEVRWHWDVVSAARRAGLDLLRPGVDPRAVYAAYVEALGPLREHAIAFFGHGMGLDMHELPYISAHSTDEISEGAIIGIEPFAMIPGRFGFQVKDVVAVTATGYEIVSDLLDGGELYVID
ncbi:M24 family metallopeptidase [Dactylosporangium sp. CA-233914]|uniref:M24 family metallopeptidase n=1 Tax=Dactylosporangium sp. CA-233914 TaxID=3239934 RepID=UPI003D8E4949